MVFDYLNVIVTYNRKNKLKEEINSLLRQTYVPKKIIIIDNHSDDDTENFCKKLVIKSSLFIYKRLNQNLGGAGGFYEGVKLAHNYDINWIALSDDDVIYNQNYFREIAVKSQKFKNVSCFTGKITFPNGRIQLNHRRKLTNNFYLKQEEFTKEAYKRDFFIDLFSFVGVVINKKIINTIYFPEKDYFIWGDDTEYSLRMRKYTKILNVSEAVAIHNNLIYGRNGGFFPRWKTYYGIRNSILLINKYSSHPKIYKFLIPILFLRKILNLFQHYNYFHPYIKIMIRIYFHAYKDGFFGIKGINKSFFPTTRLVK